MLKVPFIDEQHYNIMYMLCTLEWVGLVPLTAAPFSFEMDVVQVGIALLHPLIFMYVHVVMCVCVYVCVSICLFVWVGGGEVACLCVCKC